MSFLLDTNILSEIRKPRPHGAVLAWFIAKAEFARSSAPTKVAGENFTPTQLMAHIGILRRMSGLGDNFIPEDNAATTLSTIRQAAADNPAITATAAAGGTSWKNFQAFRSILQKANSALEAPHAATLAQYADVPADVTPVQAAVKAKLPHTLTGEDPESAAALSDLSQRIGTVNTMGGMNDLRQWLNNEASAGYKQDGVAANRGTVLKLAYRLAANAARDAYYNQMQLHTGIDFRPLKAQQSALLDQQKGAAKLGQTLSAQQAIAEEPKNLLAIAGEVLTGSRTLKGGPIAGAAQLASEKFLGQTPLRKPNYLLKKMLSDLPPPSDPGPSAPLGVPPPPGPSDIFPNQLPGGTIVRTRLADILRKANQ